MLPPQALQVIKDESRTLANETVLLSLITLLCAEDKTLAGAMVGDLERLGTDRKILRLYAKFASQFGNEAGQAFREAFGEKINALGSTIAASVPCKWNDI